MQPPIASNQAGNGREGAQERPGDQSRDTSSRALARALAPLQLDAAPSVREHRWSMAAAPVSLAELAGVFFRIGWLAFGGPVAQLGLIHDECVERRGWLDDEQFVRALNFVH